MKNFSFLFVLVLIWSCNNSGGGSSEASINEISNVASEISFLALGDSYTIGESVGASERWPVQLADSLRKKGFAVKEPRIIATTGWTTADLLEGMREGLGEESYDLVSISIGVNNQYQGRSVTEYEEELREIFSEALELSRRGREGVFVVSIPDYGATPFGEENSEEIAREIEEFNAVLEETAEEYGVDFYDITPISRRARNHAELTAADDLHPSARMYQLWVGQFLHEVVQKLDSRQKR